ncbi:unnamed protein product [Cyprideis torosa]|uniref:Uncharacterized protein n=1 Tax=Cyprideis torosa TaxID=163714 RepID=A0A7R8ZIS8_9CRUS|nr:unnamed protein product [Cyprideis torosa]CAG0886890.1 unnamed protein product [Cyprideis torosa]
MFCAEREITPSNRGGSLERPEMMRSLTRGSKTDWRTVDGEDELKKRQLMELAIMNGTYRDSSSKLSAQEIELGKVLSLVSEMGLPLPRFLTPITMAMAPPHGAPLRSPIPSPLPAPGSLILHPRIHPPSSTFCGSVFTTAGSASPLMAAPGVPVSHASEAPPSGLIYPSPYPEYATPTYPPALPPSLIAPDYAHHHPAVPHDHQGLLAR